MLKKFQQKFNKLPQSNKAMVYLTWLYSVGILVTTIFVNIYVFKTNNSVIDNIVYNIIFFSSTFLGFSGIGFLMSLYQKNIRNLYYLGYSLFVLSFISLFLLDGRMAGVYFFALIFGIGNGAFWCALHTQELKNIKDENRDFYSSSISAGKNILEIIIPIGVAFAFFMGEKYHFDGYKIIFGTLPVVFFLSFFFIKDIDAYYPKKVRKEDVKNFCNLKKYKYGHIYFLLGGFHLGLGVVVLAVTQIYLLKSEMNIGLFQGLLSIVSTFVVVHLGLKRKVNNRLKYFGIIGSLLCINLLFLAFNFNLVGLIIFSLISLLVQPLYRVSSHVYDLKLMDNIKYRKSDFYPAMLMREVILWIGRVSALIFLYFLFTYFSLSLEEFLKMGIAIIGILFIVLYGSIYLWEKNEK